MATDIVPELDMGLVVVLLLIWCVMTLVLVFKWLKRSSIASQMKRESRRIEGLRWLDHIGQKLDSADDIDSLLEVRSEIGKWREICVQEQYIHVERLLDKLDDKIRCLSI